MILFKNKVYCYLLNVVDDDILGIVHMIYYDSIHLVWLTTFTKNKKIFIWKIFGLGLCWVLICIVVMSVLGYLVEEGKFYL